jgi:uncharacterized protein YdhG (YjbR/CyaY superfamily)
VFDLYGSDRWVHDEPMPSDATTVQEYLAGLPEDRREAITAVRDTVNSHLPDGYEETLQFGMITWSIPLAAYPNTYNGKPLGIAALASQKNHMAIYLMGMYTDGPDEQWFRKQYADRGVKLDMGKSCVRFNKIEDVPLDVLGEAIERIPPDRFIDLYETSRGIR